MVIDKGYMMDTVEINKKMMEFLGIPIKVRAGFATTIDIHICPDDLPTINVKYLITEGSIFDEYEITKIKKG